MNDGDIADECDKLKCINTNCWYMIDNYICTESILNVSISCNYLIYILYAETKV